MDYNEITKIKNMVALNTLRKSNHKMDGDYFSIFRGQSLEFAELSEYHYGDNIRDIAWKASSAHGKTLVRRYIAQRRQRVLMVTDCGEKMSGQTSKYEEKALLAKTTLGALAWVFTDKGCDYSLLYSKQGKIGREPFHCGIPHMVAMLNQYEKNVENPDSVPLHKLLQYAAVNYDQEMFMVVITDLEGLTQLDEKLIRMLTFRKDLMVICIEDAYLTGNDAFDVEKKRYIRTLFQPGRKLREAERRMRETIFEEKKKLLQRNGAGLVMIREENEIMEGIVSLFQKVYKR